MLQMFILSNLYIANLLLYRYLSVADVLTTRQMLQMFIFILQIFVCFFLLAYAVFENSLLYNTFAFLGTRGVLSSNHCVPRRA